MGYVFKVENDKTLTCSIFDDFTCFPKYQKLAKIELQNGMDKYLLIDEIISPYDSGVRREQKNKIYQIDMSYAYNIFDVKFTNETYYLNLLNLQYACLALRNIFDSRVKEENNCLYFTSPRKELGITKMLVVGLNVEISYIDKYEDDNINNTFLVSTYQNGWCNYYYNNIDRFKTNAMLIKFDSNRIYRLKFNNSFKNIMYKSNDIKNCLFFGKIIEELPEVSDYYSHLFHTNNFFTTNPETLELENYKSVRCRNELMKMKMQFGYSASHQYIYNFYNLNDLKFF